MAPRPRRSLPTIGYCKSLGLIWIVVFGLGVYFA